MKFNRRQFMQMSGNVALGASLAGSPLVFGQGGGVRAASGMPVPDFVSTNGIEMAVYEQGSGPAVIFCHGFPELAYSWRKQIPAVAAAGFHCLAPDQRGYGLTGGPEDPALYDVGIFCADLVGLMDARDIDKAVFCGHDWGGAVVWAMPRLYPERCLGVIGLNTAAGRPEGLPPADDARPNDIVMTPNYYVATFMEPGRAEAVLEADVRKTFEFILSGGGTGIWDAEAFAQLPADSAERQMDLLRMLSRENPPGEPFLPDAEMQYFIDTFEATGFTGGLNWYRAIPRMGAIFADAAATIDVPCLYIGAENDVILPPYSANGMEDFIADLEKYTVMESGHWTQQEKPEEVNRVIIEWLRRKIV